MKAGLKVCAALFAAAIAPALATLGYLLIFHSSALDTNKKLLDGPFVIFLYGLAHAFILGFPLYLILKKFNLVRWWSCLIGGYLVAAIPLALFLHSLIPGFALIGFMVPGLLGMIGGFAAWLTLRSLQLPVKKAG